MKLKTSILKSSLYGMTLAMLSQTATAMLPDTELNTANAASSKTTYLAQPRFIVKYKSTGFQALSSANSVSSQMSSKAGQKVKYLRKMSTGAHVVQVVDGMSESEVAQMISNMQSDSSIEYFEEDRIMQIMATPSDPQYNNQWHYYEATGGLNLPTAWDSSTGSGAVVAVLDTGITNHVDLNANMLPGYDMISDAGIANDGDGRDSNPADTGDATAANECQPNTPARSSSWHGSHVAGTVAAVTNNGLGVAGVAYNAKVVPIRVLGKCGGFTSDIADGMIWAAGGSVPGVPNNPNPADVINLSLGGGGSCDSTSQAAINQAVSLGATVVVAAGNSNQNVSNSTPANCNNVVSVAAVGRNGGRAFYSNFGSLVDVAAPGGDQSTSTSDGVLSTLNSGSGAPAGDIYQYYQGTSMATPHVAGAAALLYSLTPNITPAEVESVLKSTARSFPSTCSGCGAGIVDAAAAVATQGSTPPGGNELTKGVAKTGLSGALQTETFYTIDVPAGASDLAFNLSGGSGDADLYVSFAANPTASTYDCRSWLVGNTEVCNFASPSAGTYHVMIRAYAAYSGASLVADYTAASGQPDSISLSGLSGSQGQWLDYELDVPAGQSSVNVSIAGGTGDADVYVRFGANPTTSTYDCRPWLNGNNETCTINNAQQGTYFIRIRGYRAFSGVSLNASSQ
ncbi:MAG: S8 family serine peptidase [Arenicella sp.]|nr:S8 family serine peptidase [Arenicella sp.]